MSEVKEQSAPSSKDLPQLSSISDVELLKLFKADIVEIALNTFKDKQNNEKIIQTLQYKQTKQPLLAPGGYVECEAKILFGMFERCKRNTGQYAKTGPDAKDECTMTFGTKYSGTYGALMLFYSDVVFRNAVATFSKRTDILENTLNSEHYPNCIYKKKIGSKQKPVKPEEQAAYIKAEDWRFSQSVRMEKYVDKETGQVLTRPFMFKVTKYVIPPGKRLPVEEIIPVDSDNIHKTFTRNSVIRICMTFGPVTRKASTLTKDGNEINIYQYFPAFNLGNMTIVEPASTTRGINVKRGQDEMLALARRFAAASISSAVQEEKDGDDHADADAQENDGDGDQDAPESGPPTSAAASSASSAQSIRDQLAALAKGQ